MSHDRQVVFWVILMRLLFLFVGYAHSLSEVGDEVRINGDHADSFDGEGQLRNDFF